MFPVTEPLSFPTDTLRFNELSCSRSSAVVAHLGTLHVWPSGFWGHVFFFPLADASHTPPPRAHGSMHPPCLCCGRAAVEHSAGRPSRTSQMSSFGRLESVLSSAFWFWMADCEVQKSVKALEQWEAGGGGGRPPAHPVHENVSPKGPEWLHSLGELSLAGARLS